MKKIYLLILLCTCFTFSIFANGIEIDGIYYLLDNTNYTASVTYTGSSNSNNSYMGEVFIPSSVDYNSHVYSVTIIGDYAFSGCGSLTSVTIPNSITSIGGNAFYNCHSLTSITIPNSVTYIDDHAFSLCSSLLSVTIGNSVMSIGNYAFSGCWGLTTFDVASDNPNYCSVDGVLFNRDTTTLIQCPEGQQGAYTIPCSVTNIGNNAFQDCRSLTSITLPNSISSIGDYAFDYCFNLTSMKLPDGVINIGNDAFHHCYGLVSIDIPNSVINIGDFAFQDCNSLTLVVLGDSIKSIGIYAFRDCRSLGIVVCHAIVPPTLGSIAFSGISSSAILYVPYESIDAYKAIYGYVKYFSEIKGLFSDVEDITTSSATLKWIPDSTVTQYDINIYTGGTHFAQYLVDSKGNIISSQRFAPSIYHHKLDTTVSSTEYFVISLDGLSAGTNYSYTIDGINAQSAPIYHEEGSFKTLNEDTEGLLDIISDDPHKQVVKIFRDGQIFILRGDKIYTLTGQEVK